MLKNDQWRRPGIPFELVGAELGGSRGAPVTSTHWNGTTTGDMALLGPFGPSPQSRRLQSLHLSRQENLKMDEREFTNPWSTQEHGQLGQFGYTVW